LTAFRLVSLVTASSWWTTAIQRVPKEKPSLPRTAFLLDPDGLLYLDKSSVEAALRLPILSEHTMRAALPLWRLDCSLNDGNQKANPPFVVFGPFPQIDIET
jgi:hypothetical protein